jgi:hypothetical protein
VVEAATLKLLDSGEGMEICEAENWSWDSFLLLFSSSYELSLFGDLGVTRNAGYVTVQGAGCDVIHLEFCNNKS